MPYYLNESDVELQWFIGGQEINEGFIEENPEMNILISGDEISFITPSDLNGMTLGVNIFKHISDEEKQDLFSAWGIDINRDYLEEQSSISVRRDISDISGQEELSSVKVFFASTVKNAPEYILFFLKLSVIVVLIWSALFGSMIFLDTYKKQ